MDLWTLLIFLDTPGQPPIRLVYKDATRAASAYDHFNRSAGPGTEVRGESDDYGRRLSIDVRHCRALQLTHVNEELNGEIDLQLLQAHAQATLQKRASTDPMLRQPQGIVPANFTPNPAVPPFGRN